MSSTRTNKLWFRILLWLCVLWFELEICAMHEYVQWPFDLMVQTVAIGSITWCSMLMLVAHQIHIHNQYDTLNIRQNYIYFSPVYLFVFMLWMRTLCSPRRPSLNVGGRISIENRLYVRCRALSCACLCGGSLQLLKPHNNKMSTHAS